MCRSRFHRDSLFEVKYAENDTLFFSAKFFFIQNIVNPRFNKSQENLIKISFVISFINETKLYLYFTICVLYSVVFKRAKWEFNRNNDWSFVRQTMIHPNQKYSGCAIMWNMKCYLSLNLSSIFPARIYFIKPLH